MTHTTGPLFLGIDGGGTKTEAVIINENKAVLGKGVANGANLHNAPITQVINNILHSIELAKLDVLNRQPAFNFPPFDSACLGLAGIDTPSDHEKFTSLIKSKPQLFPTTKLFLCNDGFIGLKSGTFENIGVCIISSTGNNCYGINQSGQQASAGNWGYLLGDDASGFSIGLKLIKTIIKQSDGRLPLTNLTNKVLTHLGLAQVSDLISLAYANSVPVKAIASLSQLLTDPDVVSTQIATDILNQTVAALIEAYIAVVNTLGLTQTNKQFSVVLVGGLFNLQNDFQDNVKSAILTHTPNVHLIRSTTSLAEAAALLAQTYYLNPPLLSNVITYIKTNGS